MTFEDRMDRWERRQEAMIASLNGMLDVLVAIRDSQTELADWLKKPQSSELADVLKALVASSQEVGSLMIQLGGRMDALPAAVARAVLGGEVA